MLSRLVINNVALISKLQVEFGSGLCILTGETGAGKSIIVDSLMLLLGARYDKTLLKYGECEGFVEGVFSDVDSRLFEDVGLEVEDIAIIKRRFNQDGKNDIKINGQTVTLSMLKRFSARLVDIYGQNEYQSLTVPSKHLDILDYYARVDIEEPLRKLDELCKQYGELSGKLKSIGDDEQRRRSIDILSYQIDEIKAADIKENEEQEIINRRKILLSSEKIKSNLMQATALLSGTDMDSCACDMLQLAAKSLAQISLFSAGYDELYSRIETVLSEINDISEVATAFLDDVSFEESELDQLEKRLEVIRSIKRKYGDYPAMQEFFKKTLQELEFLQNSDEMYERLINSKQKTIKEIYKLSNQISQARRNCAKTLEQRVIAELAELGMKDSRFEIVFSDFPSLEDCESLISKDGMDRAEFYLSANLGQPLLPLAKIISGGEMSRFMLALKVISSDTDTVQTMIFDEIDTGISGKMGQVIAQKLAKISRKRQVLCVTHLPQIAAMADGHFYITKNQVDGHTTTNLKHLEPNEMIAEISRLSGGQDISSQSLANAKEIKDWSNSFKNSLG